LLEVFSTFRTAGTAANPIDSASPTTENIGVQPAWGGIHNGGARAGGIHGATFRSGLQAPGVSLHRYIYPCKHEIISTETGRNHEKDHPLVIG